MAKSQSPIRLQEDLMKAASAAGEHMHRSTAEQIEYWASIGRSVSSLVDPNKVLDILAGLATLEVKQVDNINIDFDDVVDGLEEDRKSGRLNAAVSAPDEVAYQVCPSKPGYLEEIHPDGTVKIGKFVMGEFKEEELLPA